ncbi:MAG: cytochrome c oxidase assembly protein [Candidatus Eremiobacteraeota bacterium]|nr:cytochrome c oxidase assembly protein [Candidatus Eremiobacteraeota bacterium]
MRRALFLSAAVFAGIAAVAPPLERLADVSFGWHMVQHLILFYIVSLLLLLARPFDLFTRVAPKGATAALVRAIRPLHVVARPPVAFFIFVAALWATHFSPLYELSLEYQWVHVAEHMLYLAAGIVFWLPVVAAPPVRPLAYPARLLYLIVALPQGALLGMVLVSQRTPLYSHYLAPTGSLSAALADQRNAGAVMWIAGGLIVLTALLATLATWAARERDFASS